MNRLAGHIRQAMETLAIEPETPTLTPAAALDLVQAQTAFTNDSAGSTDAMLPESPATEARSLTTGRSLS